MKPLHEISTDNKSLSCIKCQGGKMLDRAFRIDTDEWNIKCDKWGWYRASREIISRYQWAVQ